MRRFVLRRFTFTTLVQSDRALPTCGASLSQLKRPNEELSDLYPLPNIVRVVKSRRMRWAGHVARMGEGRDVHRVLVGKPE